MALLTFPPPFSMLHFSTARHTFALVRRDHLLLSCSFSSVPRLPYHGATRGPPSLSSTVPLPDHHNCDPGSVCVCVHLFTSTVLSLHSASAAAKAAPPWVPLSLGNIPPARESKCLSDPHPVSPRPSSSLLPHSTKI